MRLVVTAAGRAAALIALLLLSETPSDPVHAQAIGVDDGVRPKEGNRELARKKTRTIYEQIDFETDENVCGSLSSVKSRIEEAFLSFFEEQFEDCDSDRDVESVVLVEFHEAELCSDDSRDSRSKPKRKPKGKGESKGGGGSKSKGSKGSESKGSKGKGGSKGRHRALETTAHRELNRHNRSSGRLNVVSKCTRCGRRLEGIYQHLEATGERFDGTARHLGRGKGGKGKGQSRDSKGKSEGSKGQSKGSKGQSKGSKGQSKGSSKGSTAKSNGGKGSCDADLAAELRKVGFDGVKMAKITRIRRFSCSPNTRMCTSTRSNMGACCGADGCACNTPSKSLCKANDYCVEVSDPFDPDFCEDYGDTSECESE